MVINSKKRRSNRAIRGAADHFGISEEVCRKEMQACLDDAWVRSRQNPASAAEWEKPSLEVFLDRMAAIVRNEYEKAGV